MRCAASFCGADGQRRAGKRRAQAHFREKEIRRGSGVDATQPLHRFVLREQLERHRRSSGHHFIEKNGEFPAAAIDSGTGRTDIGGAHLFEPPDLALELVGVGNGRFEPDHLDRAHGLVNLVARLPEQGQIRRRGPECGEQVLPARQREAYLDLHPRQRPHVEVGNGIGRGGGRGVHGHAGSGSAAAAEANTDAAAGRRVRP